MNNPPTEERPFGAPIFFQAKRIMSEHPKKTGFFLVALLVALLFFVRSGNGVVTDEPERKATEVELASIRDLSSESQSLSFLGEVRSVSQAELRAQKSGKVLRMYASAGDTVQAGTILAEIENSAERAMVLSAQGALQSAFAQYEKTRAGARSEDLSSVIVQAQTSELTLASAKDTAQSAYMQAYAVAQDAVYATADTHFSNPYTVNPTFRVRSATFNERAALSRERVAIGMMLEQWQEKARLPLPEEDLEAYLVEAIEHLDRIKRFLSDISLYVSKQVPDEILTVAQKLSQEGAMAGARASIDGVRGAVQGARTNLVNLRGATEVARLTETRTLIGARSEDIAIAEAMVTQARGALASANAALENSLLRTPIAGTVSTLNVGIGDYVSMSQPIAVVANEGALEVVAFVSDQARDRVQVGDGVIVDGQYPGTVTSIAPGLDPVTKKMRMTVSVAKEAPLRNGSFARVRITPHDELLGDDAQIIRSVPITAVKVLPRTLAVFTVNSDGEVISLPITEGPIVGDRIIILDGVTLDTEIIIDARGIAEGDVVTVVR